jgi:hypothetical protein
MVADCPALHFWGSATSLLGLIVTLAALPETEGKSLEEIESEAAAPAILPAQKLAA